MGSAVVEVQVSRRRHAVPGHRQFSNALDHCWLENKRHRTASRRHRSPLSRRIAGARHNGRASTSVTGGN